MRIRTINPTTEKTIETFEMLSYAFIDQQLEVAHKSQLEWANIPVNRRKKFLKQLSNELKKNTSYYGSLITEAIGKPISQSKYEIQKCANLCDYFTENLEEFLAPTKTSKDDNNYYQLCPSGIVFAIMPWNIPFLQVFRSVIPNLTLGNGIVFSHAHNVLGIAEAIQKLMIKCGLPEGLLQNLIVDHEQSEYIINHSFISGVTLVGRQKTGKHIATIAGNALKKVVLELGGNDPYLILEDADLDFAAKTLVEGRFRNAGQISVSPKRIIVIESIFEAFKKKVYNLVKTYHTGNPFDENCMIGPMARADLREKIHQQIQTSIDLGAECLIGGYFEDKVGYYYAPTLLANVKPGMPAFDDELFGPVVSLIQAEDERDAISLANQSCYGLGSGVFSKDINKAEKILTNHLHVGLGKINGLVYSDPKLPFGGVKGSGFGRECGTLGLQEFANIKTIIV